MTPLQGITLLDLTNYLPGPYATQILRDLGARVIKIEASRGDPSRFMPPFVDGVGSFFATIHEGKESLCLNLKNPTGVTILHQLASKADGLIEGFRPGVLARLGITTRSLHEANPKLVIASLSGYGASGPLRDIPGHDANYLGYSGALSLNVDKDKNSVMSGMQIADMAGGLQLALGVVAGLLRAEKDGHGCVITTSMYESALSLVTVYMGTVLAGGDIVPGQMLLCGAMPCYQLYKAKDGRWLTFCPLEPKFWMRFCALTNQDDWMSRAFDSTLIPELQSLFETKTSKEWLDLLEAEACVGPVLTLQEAIEHPHAKALGILSNRRVRAPWRFNDQRPECPNNLSQEPGSERDNILTELLGWDAQRIQDHEENGAFG